MHIDELKKRFGIGLTGGIATGKTIVGQLLGDLGQIVIDADLLAREAVQPGSSALTKIVATFGSEFLLPNGSLDRRKMRQRIFTSPQDKHRLEAITHPAIHQLLAAKLADHHLFQSPKIWFYEAALLVETGRYRDFRQLWVTRCSAETQLQRLIKRDHLHHEEAQRTIASQMPLEDKVKVADLIIDTEASPARIKTFLQQSLRLL